MKLIIVISIIAAISIYGCKTRKNETLTATINITNPDTCFDLSAGDSVLFRRDIEILENTLSDTIGLGFGVVAPNRLGKMIYMQNGVNDVVYYEPALGTHNLSPINSVCFQPYRNKKAESYLKIKFQKRQR